MLSTGATAENKVRPHKTLPAPLESRLSRLEAGLFTLLFAGLLALRVYYTSRYRIDSDEPQHLHVVWGWVHGLLPYRDIFDNHTPLFQFLSAPLLWLSGDRADGIIWMRWAMVAWQVVTLMAVFKIGAALFSRRTGLWAAVMTGYYPRFFLISMEFRPDDLWVALWVVSLWLMLAGKLTLRRAFWCGVVIGATFTVSLKTTLLLLSVIVGAMLCVVVMLVAREPVPWSGILRKAGAALGGMLIFPAIVCLAFFTAGIWREFFYGTVTHNVMPGMGRWGKVPLLLRWSFPLFIVMALPAGLWLVRTASSKGMGLRRSMFLFVTGSVVTLLYGYWPLIERETLLAFIPIVLLLTAAVIVWPVERVVISRWKIGLPLTSVMPFGLVAWSLMQIIEQNPPGKDRTAAFVQHVDTVLRLTDPNDYVMDAKGESIYRRRPFFYALEPITEARIRAGLLADDMPEQMVSTRTCVATLNRLQGKDRSFVTNNYIHVTGSVLVVGRWIKRGLDATDFDNEIATRYTLMAKQGPVSGTVDGQVFNGSFYLTRGPHQIKINKAKGKVALIWAQAVERGGSPFGDFDADVHCGLNVDDT